MQANQIEIVMTKEHQDAWDEIAAEQLALAKAEMAQRSPEEQERRDKAFWEKFSKPSSKMSDGEWSEEIKQAVALLKANEFQVVPNFPHRICLLGSFNNHVQQIGELLAEIKELKKYKEANEAKKKKRSN